MDFIDDEGVFGTIWQMGRRERLLARELQRSGHEAFLHSLGFIGVSLRKGWASITFKPRLRSRAALAGLNYWLIDAAPGRVVLTVLEPGYCPEICGSVEVAARRVEVLANEAQASLPSGHARRRHAPGACSGDRSVRKGFQHKRPKRPR